MSSEAIRFIRLLPDGPNSTQVPKIARKTLHAIAALMHEGSSGQLNYRRCYARQTTIASDIGISVRTLREHLKLLEAQLIIVRVRQAMPGGFRQGVQGTILIVGFSDQAEAHAAWSKQSIQKGKSSKRQLARDLSETIAAPTGNQRTPYRETKVITLTNQEQEGGHPKASDDGLIPINWRSHDLEWLWQNNPREPLSALAAWLWALEREHGVDAVTTGLKRTRPKITDGSIAYVKAYIETAVANAMRQNPHESATATVGMNEFGPKAFAKPSAALLKIL
jgi:DNA-binding HxlR family transcriptional regulator